MRNLLLFTAIVAFTITSCQKRHKKDVVTGKLNGHEWDAKTSMAQRDWVNTDRFFITASFNAENGEHSLGIQNVPFVTGRYPVYSFMRWIDFGKTGEKRGRDSCTGSYHLSYGGVGANSYDVINEEENYVEVTGYDSKRNVVKGNFKMNLYRLYQDREPAEGGMPDTLRFSEGRFELWVEDSNQ